MAKGPLLIIGGGEDKGEDSEILRRFVHLASSGGREARVGVVTTASSQGEAMFVAYARAFQRIGLNRVEALSVHHRSSAQDEAICRRLEGMSGVFFGGGDQLRITSMLGGSRFHQTLLNLNLEGLVVAGTSAGASMMSLVMIVEGDARQSPTKNTVKMATGMGLWTGAVIDQHFSQRGRIGRLLSAVAQNPDILGVGLDENTAIEVRLQEGHLQVWGQATVTIVDGRQIEETNASESEDNQPLALTGVILHVLPRGFGMDLNTRRPYLMGDTL